MIIILPLFMITILKADTVLIDLSSNLSIVPATVEVSQDFNSTITITNETTGSTTLDGNGATIKYHIPSGSSYSGNYSGAGWNCNGSADADNNISCQYNQTLNNGDTSNPLNIILTAPSTTGSSNPTLTVIATTTDANTTNNDSTAPVEFGKSNLNADKTVSSPNIGLNQNFTYTISVSNPYNGSNPTVKARNVTITDNLPGGVSFVSVSDTSWCSESGGVVSCSGADLDPGSSRSVTITVQAVSGGIKTNTASIDTDSSDYNTLPLTPSVNVTVQPADIALSKTLLGGIDANNAEVNSTVTYNISVTNNGQTSAEDVNFTDTLPAGVSYVGISQGSWNCSGSSTITCSLPSPLAYNQTKDVNITVKMPPSHQQVDNTATAVTSTDEGGQTSDDSDTLTTYVRGVDLRITKTGNNATAKVGSNYTYTITVANNGPVDAQNVVVTDILDSRMTYVSDTGGCTGVATGDTGTMTCAHGALNSGASYSFDVTVKMPTDSLNDVTNSASVTNDIDEENSLDNNVSSTTHLMGPDLDITKDANVSAVGLGKSFTYTLNITSNNDINATDVNITDTLPAGVEITGINSGTFNCPSTPITGTFSCTKSNFQGNATDTIVLTAKAPANVTGDITNNVVISQSLNQNDGSASKTVTVTGVTLGISKSASATATVGGLIDYNVTVTNASHSDAQNVTITDNLATYLGAGYTVNSIIDATDWSCSGVDTSQLSCTKDSDLLAEGDSSTIHFDVNVPLNAALGTVTNTAEANTSTLPKPTVSATASTVIKGSHLIVTKTGDIIGTANEPIYFAIEVQNDGSADANDVNLTINLNTNNAADFTNIETDCGSGTYSSVTEPFTCSLGNIPGNNGNKTIHIRAVSPNFDSTYASKNISNSAIATTSTPEENTNNDHTSWSVPINGADLIVNKAPSSQDVAVGQTVTYTITLKNQGDANATNISLDDIVHTSTTPLVLSNLNAGAGWNCTTSFPSSFHCTYNSSLAKNESASNITIDATVPTNAPINTQLNNDVNVSNNTAEVDYINTNQRTSPVTVRGADVNITKTVNKSTVSLGEQVVFTITVTNNDLADAQDVNVTDSLPAGFSSISTDCANQSISGQNVTCQLGTLAHNGGTSSFTITANAPTTNGIFNNIATVSTSTPESDYTNNDDNATVNVQGADLAINKIDSADPVAVNSLYNYTINVTNIGRSSAFGADINDTLPSSLTFDHVISTDANWTCDTSAIPKIHCYTNDPNMELPGTASGNAYNHNIITFQVRAPSSEGTVSNTAYVDTNTSESNKNNNHDTETTRVININLQARKDVNGINPWNTNPTYIGIGGDLTYKLYVRNQVISNVDGTTTVNIPITDINISDKLPTNITNISVTPSSSRFTCDSNAPSPGDTLNCQLSGSALQTSEQWILVATITAKATTNFYDIDANTIDAAHNWIINQYHAVTSLGDSIPADNAPGGNGYLETDTLIRGANMSITKTVSTDPIGANQPFSYTISTKNYPRTGNAAHDIPSTTATNIVVKDVLPNDVNYTSASGTNWSCSEASHIITCNYSGTLAPNASAPNITVDVSAPNAIETVINEANVTTDTPELTSLLNDNNDSVSTNIIGTKLSVIKSGTAVAGMGDELTYDINVTNVSNVPAKSILVYDQLHSGVSLSSGWNRDINTADWNCIDNSASSAHNVVCSYKGGDLASGATIGFRIYTKAPNYTGTIVNRAIATSSTVGDNNVTADFPTLIKGADIDFANNPFVQSPSPVGAYHAIDYNVTIENKGYSQAQDINFTMKFPTGFSQEFNVTSTNSSDPWSCNFDDTNIKLTCTLPTLAPSNTTSMIHIHALAPNANQIVSYNLSVTAKDSEGNTTSSTLTPNPTTNVKGSDLKITKYARDPDPHSDGLYHDNNITVGVGKEIDFKLSVTNQNLGLAKDINITDTLPAGFSDINITNPGDWNCSIASSTIVCSRTSLDADTNASDILYSATTPGYIGNATNTAHINTSTAEVDTTNNSSSIDIKLEGATLNASFNASKTEVAMGEIFSYILDINNSGRNPAVDVNTSDIFPSDFTYMDSNGSDSGWTCSNAGNHATCNQPNIPAYGGTTKLILNVQAPANTIGTYPNDINISSNSIENSILSVAPNVRVIGADIAADINATPNDVLEDRNVTYNINVKDINISTAKNVTLKQTFDKSVNALYIINGSSDCNLTDANQSVTCSFGDLAYNADKNITIIATMPFAGNNDTVSLTSTVETNTTSTQENTANDTKQATVTVHKIKPVADYRFDECKWNGTNGVVIDSINGLNGTAKNGAKTLNYILTQDDNNFSTIWRVGKFDGNNDYISITNNAQLQIVKDQTYCAWVKPTSFHNRRNIIEKAYGGEGTITQEADGTLSYYYGTNGGNGSPYQGFESNRSLRKNYWNHICVVRDLNNMKLYWYIDGNLTNSTNANFSQAVASTKNIHIGKGYAGYFKGNIDEVEIYNIALDDRAVKDIYNNEKAHKNYDGTSRNEPLCGVDLRVTKVPSMSPVGAETAFTYTITVKNRSSEPLTTGFTLYDTMPAGLTLDTNGTTYSDPGFTCVGTHDFNCTILTDDILYHNDTRSVTITAIAPNSTGEHLTNSATVQTGVAGTTGQPDTNNGNNSDSATVMTLGTDLGVTKTATLDTNGSNLIHYTMTVTNHSSLTPATGITIIDTYDSRLSLITPPDSISCTIPASEHYFTCTLPNIAPGDSLSFTSTMQAQSGTDIVNDINVTSHTVDTDLSNNHTQVSLDINVSGSNAPVKLKDGFRKHVSTNNYGNMVVIGNTILQANNQDGNTSLTDVNTSYVNVASQPLNSSSATLNIPENNVTIEYAGLYWGGHIKGQDNNDTLTGTFNTIKLTTPSGDTFTIVGGDQENGSIISDDNATGFYRFKRFASSTGRLYYSSEANVTSIIRNEYATNGNINGIFIVSDLNVSYGLDNSASFIPDDTSPSHWSFFNSGFFGGWELVVIYSVDHRQYRSVRYKNSTIFDGFKVLMPRSPGQSVSLDLNVSGFITPHEGDIESTLFSMVFAGDMTLPYESMSVTDISNTPHLVKEGASNTDNIFNDTISLQNIDTTPIVKNLNLNYNPGIDLDEFDLTSQYDSSGNCISSPCYLSNAQTSTKINLQVSESDTPIPGTTQYPAQYAFVNMLGFNTQIFTPDFIDSYKECFKKKEPGSLSNDDWVPCSDPMPPIHRGSMLKYRITIINSGTDDAIDVHVTDPLPREVDFNGSCASPNSDITATNIYDLPDGIIGGASDLDFDYNSTLRSISGECKSTLYDYNQSVRDECVADIKAVLIDGNETTPLGTMPDGNGETMNLIDPSYNGTTCSSDANGTTLVFNYPAFPKKSVTWIEFYTKINGYATLGQSFQNAVSINFTNQTLSDAGINNLQTQQSEPVDSGTVTFNWEHIVTLFKDPGRNSVGTKIVNKPFDLNISLSGISSLDVDTGGNTTMSISNLQLVDAYNGLTSDITTSLVSPSVPVDSTDLGWSTHNTNYDKASKEIGFQFDLTLSYNNDYNETKHYPSDFNSSAPYAGDVFTTRPKGYSLSVVGATNAGGYTVAKAAQGETLDVNATDETGTNALKYNAVLSKTNGINISLDSNFSTNPACIDINALNINNLTFANGNAQAANTKYTEVGVIKFDLTDSNWTAKDQTNGDCVAGSGTNTAVGGIIGCNVEGNSSSIVFTPDHFDFNATTVSDFGNGFTYMVTDPLTDQVYGKLTTNVISKNVDNNTTRFFSATCFADNVQVNLGYNVDSVSLNDLNLSVANESNLTNIESNASLAANNNIIDTSEQNNSFASGMATLNLRAYVDKNKTTPLEPAIVDFQDINGSLNDYLGITGVNVAPTDVDISPTNDIHFIYGRIHAPNYSSDNDVINAKIYYEGYCKDCNKSKFPSLGGEDADSIYWYVNTGQNSLADGNISGFIQPATTKITITPANSTAINGGDETHTITYNGATYPYRERVDMNASSWLIFDPYDANATTSSFFVDFSKYNDWAGVGQTGKTVDLNISSKGSKRIEW